MPTCEAKRCTSFKKSTNSKGFQMSQQNNVLVICCTKNEIQKCARLPRWAKQAFLRYEQLTLMMQETPILPFKREVWKRFYILSCLLKYDCKQVCFPPVTELQREKKEIDGSPPPVNLSAMPCNCQHFACTLSVLLHVHLASGIFCPVIMEREFRDWTITVIQGVVFSYILGVLWRKSLAPCAR